MHKNKKPIFLLYALPIIVVIFTTMFFLRKNDDKEITISKAQWGCIYENTFWKCDVNFSVRNNTHKQIVGVINVRGVNLKKSNRTRLHAISDPSQVTYDLNEYEQKELHSVIFAKLKPKRVNLTVVDKQKNY